LKALKRDVFHVGGSLIPKPANRAYCIESKGGSSQIESLVYLKWAVKNGVMFWRITIVEEEKVQPGEGGRFSGAVHSVVYLMWCIPRIGSVGYLLDKRAPDPPLFVPEKKLLICY
jgi:hypothetical protein